MLQLRSKNQPQQHQKWKLCPRKSRTKCSEPKEILYSQILTSKKICNTSARISFTSFTICQIKKGINVPDPDEKKSFSGIKPQKISHEEELESEEKWSEFQIAAVGTHRQAKPVNSGLSYFLSASVAQPETVMVNI